MAEAIVLMVVGRLTDLLTEEAQFLNVVRDEIQQVVTELMRMKAFLRDADSRISEERVGNLLAQVRDLVYDAEDVVETFLLSAMSSERRKVQGGFRNKVKRSVCSFDEYFYHHKFIKGIKQIQERIQNLFGCFSDYDIKSTQNEGHGSSSSESEPGRLKRFHTFSVVEPKLFVGFQEDVKSLVAHLVNEGDDSYPVIFIGGMGGLGKTTLAEKIYNHKTIKKHFPRLAWVSISQKWQAKHVLKRILISLVHEKKEEILQMEYDRLVENLLQVQQTKNCLVVLDDIWSSDAWDLLKAAFPTETSRSKLMLTSRILDLADHVNPRCFVHKPKVLDAEESWALLRLKAFPKGDHLTCDELRSLGKNLKLRFDGLSKLETLERFDTSWCEVKDLPKLISLQKLSLHVDGSYNDMEEMIKYLSSYTGKYLDISISTDDLVSENGADMWRQLFWNHKYNL
uniref:AAA+ ATPase domain-containing protein n=2 Tax=Daucus carota subsp. sativus TaxID=79200 RepID=A0A175YJR9_DAUCS